MLTLGFLCPHLINICTSTTCQVFLDWTCYGTKFVDAGLEMPASLADIVHFSFNFKLKINVKKAKKKQGTFVLELT